MKRSIKQLLERLYLDGVARELWQIPQRIAAKRRERRLTAHYRQLIDQYVSTTATPKLHLGCGHNFFEGWLNSDLVPNSPSVLKLDATEPLPFENDIFAFVFCEHMIEHIPYEAGCRMLEECLRVLRPGGTVRISTPDLAFLIALYGEEKSALQQEYIEWTIAQNVQFAPEKNASVVINNFVRDWGHQFIYDDVTLPAALARAGFSKISRCRINESDYPELRGLESDWRMPAGYLALETIAYEATK